MCVDARKGKEATMSHERSKPGREKRKPKKVKPVLSKADRESEVLQHVAQHGRPEDEGR